MSWVERGGKIRITILRKEGTSVKLRTFTGLVKADSYKGEIEYNATDYTFVNINGTLVKKRKLLKKDFDLEFYFQGEDHLDVSREFEEWMLSDIPWEIDHPFYGIIKCQVVKLKFDSTGLTNTKWSGTAIETIEDVPTEVEIPDLGNFVLLKINQTSTILSSDPQITPTFQDVDNLKLLTNTNYKATIPLIKIPSEAADYANALSDTITAINGITESPVLAMSALNAMILLPYQLTASVKDRINLLIGQYQRLQQTIAGLTTRTQKRIYERYASGLMSAMAGAAVTPAAGNYAKSTDVLFIINLLQQSQSSYQSDINFMKSPNGSDPLFYVPDFDIIRAIDELMNVTISKLYLIALGGKREFSYVLETDSNAILLAHRFYGLDANDANLNEFIANNAITYRLIALGIPKGTTIFYYL